MTAFDSFAMVDWSGGNDTGPRPCKDAIWMAVVRQGQAEPPVYLRNRALAEEAITALIDEELSAGRRLCIGFDFPFGYPSGFARALTGSDDPFALWDWIEARIEDAPRDNNRFDLAGEINASFPGKGPFWFNGLKREIAHLPRRDVREGHGTKELRDAEALAKGAFSCWQLGGAGAVGGQVLTGLPVLARLRRRFAGQVAAWPFEPLEAPVALVEIWPGLINPAVKRAEATGGIRDAHQVALLARALACLPATDLRAMLEVQAPEEGWIMGLGFEDKLTAAAEQDGKADLRPPPLRDDCFALPAGVDWTPVENALGMLQERLRPVVARERVSLVKALGRVLAAPVIASRSNPPLRNTAVDGYGFAHACLGEGDQILPLCEGRAAAGVPFEGKVPFGNAIRVLTGAALPEGVDTVILEEDVTLGQDAIAFRSGLKPGANTRKAGEDVEAGASVLERGRRVTPADMALIAAVGVHEVEAYAPLRVAILSTGDELREPGVEAGFGQIYDANRPMLSALVKRLGHVPVDLGIQPDDSSVLRAALDQAATSADVILTSGGASAGDEDHVSALLNEAGAIAEWRIALKPGRPLALGMWNETPIFGLPGNPVAALVCTLIFGAPAMAALSGAGWSAPQGFTVPAAFSKKKKPGRREYLRARMRDGKVEVFASEGSGRISGLSWAEGLVELPDEAAEIVPGDLVHYIPYSSFYSA